MADYRDQHLRALLGLLVEGYILIAHVAEKLPIPVTLPTGDLTAPDMAEAVGGLARIADDMPLPKTEQATLGAACAHWATAALVCDHLASGAWDLTLLKGARLNALFAQSATATLDEWLEENK